MEERVVPVRDVVLDFYADYMELEYGMMDCGYVLVTLSDDGRRVARPLELAVHHADIHQGKTTGGSWRPAMGSRLPGIPR
jgi:hypothetical protein